MPEHTPAHNDREDGAPLQPDVEYNYNRDRIAYILGSLIAREWVARTIQQRDKINNSERDTGRTERHND